MLLLMDDKTKNKISHVCEYIKNNNLAEKLIDQKNNKTLYTIDDYVYAYYFFESLGICYKKYDLLRKNLNNDHKYPSRSSISRFKFKMANYKICENIYNNYKADNNLDTQIVSIDSTFIANKSAINNSNFIGSNPFYKSKNGCKLTALVNEDGKPLTILINSANKNDASIGAQLIEDVKDTLKNKILLGDSGYDSSKIKQILSDNECKYIIPINKKGSFPDKIKEKKLNIKKNIKMEKEKVWNEIKYIKETTNDVNNIRKIKCQIGELDKQQKEQINKVNSDYRKSLKTKKRNDKKIGRRVKCTLNLPDSEKLIYKKRIKVEHFFSKIKACRLTRIYDKKMYTFRETIFSRIIEIFMCI